jgi:hypothetical protein
MHSFENQSLVKPKPWFYLTTKKTSKVGLVTLSTVDFPLGIYLQMFKVRVRVRA